MIRLKLLGGLELRAPAAPLVSRAAQKKRLALLALLGAAQPRRLSRDAVLGMLWPENDAPSARHQLASALYDLRRGLDSEAILAPGDEIALSADHVVSDVCEIEAAIARGDYRAAVEVYGGPFLDGFFLSDAKEFDEWVERERSRLLDRYAHAVERLATELERSGDAQTAVELWKRLAAQDRINGRVAQQLMQALVAAGDRASAIRHAEVHAALLRTELGVGPDPAVAALAERLKRDPPAAERVSALVPGVDESRSAAPPEQEGTDLLARPPRPRIGRRARLVGGVVSAVTIALLFTAALRHRGAEPSVESPPVRAIAVLPLKSLSSDQEQQFFAEGMTDALIGELARFGQFRVTSRTSVMRYKSSDRSLRDIASELGVDAVLEGTVVRDGARVRVTAQLIRARTDQHIWADSYERDAQDVLGLQADLSSRSLGGCREARDPLRHVP